MELSRFNSNSPGILNEYNAFKYSFENGTMKKQYFKTTCFTPEYLYLDKIRINLNAETINNTITIESKLIVNDIQQIISSLESLQSQSKEMNSQNINYIKILLENYEKENFNVLNDLIKPWHSKIHTGGLISIFGDYRKECVWIKVKDNSDFNTARFIPAPPEQIPELMNNWSILFKSKSEYPLLDALLLFYQFVTIHPWKMTQAAIPMIFILSCALE
jgi:Fic family protein